MRSTASLEGIRQIVGGNTVLEQERHDGNPPRTDVPEIGAAGREFRQHFDLPRLCDVQQTLTEHVGDEQPAAPVRLDAVDPADVLVRQLGSLPGLQVERKQVTAWPWRALAAS